MKLRILDDSIRLRLSQSEVAQIGRGETVQASARFPDGARLRYTLRVSDDARPRASFAKGELTVSLPAAIATRWATTDQVGVEAFEPLEALHGGGEPGQLRLLIEKDFRCLAPRGDEDQSDAFEHPEADERSC